MTTTPTPELSLLNVSGALHTQSGGTKKMRQRSGTLDERSKARNDGLSRQMRRRTLMRQCPKCFRKDAIRKIYEAASRLQVRVCRWCDFEEAQYL